MNPDCIRISADRPDALYRCGETATFAVSLDSAADVAGEALVTLDNFGSAEFERRTVDLAKDCPFTVRGALSEPGFLRLCIRSAGSGRKKVFGVGFEPERIRKASPSPPDFDAFWAEAKRRLDATTPVDPRMLRVPEKCTEDFDFYRVSFASHGGRVWGLLTIPKAASADGKHPVRFEIPGAGTGPWTNTLAGSRDAIRMKMTVHPEPLPFDQGELLAWHERNRARLKAKYGVEGYSIAGLGTSREDYYYYRGILGICRAADWLARRPEADATRFTYEGASQGGGLGLAVTALSPRFTKALLMVPALSDVLACQVGRRSGCGPCPVQDQLPENRERAAALVPYFDGANFASRIRCPVRVLVGFADDMCVPPAVYATYNEMTSPDRAIVAGVGMGHDVNARPDLVRRLRDWLEAPAEPRTVRAFLPPLPSL